MASRSLLAVQTSLTGFVIARISPDAVAAGPFISSFYTTTMGFSRGAMPIGQLTSGLITTDNEQRVGELLIHGWGVALSYGIPITVLYVFSKQVAQGLGLSDALATQAGDYLRPLALSVIPTLVVSNDNQFLFRLKKTRLILVFGLAYSAVSMAVGFPLTLGWFDLPKLGLGGLAIGIDVAIFGSLIATRAFMTRQEFSPYHLYRSSTARTKEYLQTLYRIGVPQGFQKIVDWGNLAGIAIVMAYLSPDLLLPASAPSSYVLVTYNLLWTETIGPVCNVYVGGKEPFRTSPSHMRNARRMVTTGVAIDWIATAMLSGTLILFKEPICRFFLDESADNYQEVLTLAQSMLFVNALGLLAEPFRCIPRAGLQGMKDVVFPPVVTFTLMTVLGLGIGTLITAWAECDNSIFITRDISILTTALLMAYHFYQQKTSAANQLPAEERAYPMEVRDDYVAENDAQFFTRVTPGDVGIESCEATYLMRLNKTRQLARYYC